MGVHLSPPILLGKQYLGCLLRTHCWLKSCPIDSNFVCLFFHCFFLFLAKWDSVYPTALVADIRYKRGQKKKTV